MILQQNMTDNSEKINIFKGIIILFVVSIHILFTFHGHNKPKLIEFFYYIIGFSVPLFLLLGGFFLSNKLININSKNYIILLLKRLLKRIMVPYYLFVGILMIFCFITNRPFSIKLFLLLDADTHGLYFIIIYIYSYVISVLSVYYLSIVFNNTNILINIIIPLISLIFFPLTKILIDYFPDNTVVCSLSYISFFIFGFPVAMICRRISFYNSKVKCKYLIFIILLFLFYTFLLYYCRKIFGFFSIIATKPPTIFFLIYSVFIFIIIYIIIEEFDIITKIGNKLKINEFGRQSLFIFFIHPYFIYSLPLIYFFFFENLIYSNLFIIPWILSSYIITFLSLKIYEFLPERMKYLFSR